MSDDQEKPTPRPEEIEESPPFQPDPDLITELERGQKPSDVKVQKPDKG